MSDATKGPWFLARVVGDTKTPDGPMATHELFSNEVEPKGGVSTLGEATEFDTIGDAYGALNEMGAITTGWIPVHLRELSKPQWTVNLGHDIGLTTTLTPSPPKGPEL